MYNNYLCGQEIIFNTFVLMSIRAVVFLYCLLAFSQVFSQGIKWEEALKLDPKNVTSLDCSGQKWDSLPMEIFQFRNLKDLDLSKNKFSTLPQAFQIFDQLEKLNLGRNKFENFPLVICQLLLLKTLHLDRNQITLLPEQIADLQALEYLDLYANGIEQFGEGIFLLPALQVLNIEGVMYGTVFAKQLKARLPQTKVLIDPPCKCLD
jgi:Leucine-rich repeat (LRR) protein